MVSETSTLQSLPGDALLYGPGMMREERWKWTRPADRTLLLCSKLGSNASLLRIFFRMLWSEARELRAIGIGGVFTLPMLRGQGFATQLLMEALTLLRKEYPSADVVMLHSAPRTLYTDRGFYEIATWLLAQPLHGDMTVLPHGVWQVEPEGHF